MNASPQQIQQAIEIIEAQLRFLKGALREGVRLPQPTSTAAPRGAEEGVVGIYDGEYMHLEGGKRVQVPPNYASKSMLVPGDTIRMIEDESGDPGKAKFKQIAKVERTKASGLLARKDGKYEVLCEEGSFKVLTASIKHFNGEVGDTVTIQFPKVHVKGSWAAVEKIHQAHPVVATEVTQPSQSPIVATSTPVMPAPTQIVHTAPEAPILTPVPDEPKLMIANDVVESSQSLPSLIPSGLAPLEPPLVPQQQSVAPSATPVVKQDAPRQPRQNRDDNRGGRRDNASGTRTSPARTSSRPVNNNRASDGTSTDRPRPPRQDGGDRRTGSTYGPDQPQRPSRPVAPPQPPVSMTSGEIAVSNVMDDDELL
jgi:hypothetical protein